jgi:predicted metallo-beta-lactamase superfamily hydrolase
MRLDAVKKKIYTLMTDTNVVTISHYHHHHYIPPQDIHASDAYRGKIIFCKDRRSKCNFIQRKRGKDFELFARRVSSHLKFVDGGKEVIGSVSLKFSEPVEHGISDKNQGYVLMTTIDDGTKRLMHCSDVLGPASKRTAEMIILEKPNIIIISGPPTHEWFLPKMVLERSKDNLKEIVQRSGAKDIILDHHTMADINYKTVLSDIFLLAEEVGVKIQSAAEYAGQPIRQLEAKRKELWDSDQLSQIF